MNLAERIKYYRKKEKLTQKELAEEIGLSVGTIKQYERGLRQPREKTLIKLCQSFRIGMADLLGLRDEIENDDDSIEQNKKEFVRGLENSADQLVFYDSFRKLQERIDNIESTSIRRKAVKDLNQLFEEIENYINQLDDSYYGGLNYFLSSRERTILESVHSLDDLLEQFYLNHRKSSK